jgi:hypothetical protein
VDDVVIEPELVEVELPVPPAVPLDVLLDDVVLFGVSALSEHCVWAKTASGNPTSAAIRSDRWRATFGSMAKALLICGMVRFLRLVPGPGGIWTRNRTDHQTARAVNAQDPTRIARLEK